MTRKGFRLPIAERMERFTDKSGGPDACWPWTGGKTGEPPFHHYGAFTIERKMTTAHRVAYELANGPIPEGLYILHRCDNPPCVNPAHLYAGTPKQNTGEMMAKGRAGFHAPRPNQRGERNPQVKLTAAQVRAIRADTETPHNVLARRLGVSAGLISQVRHYRAWRHI